MLKLIKDQQRKKSDDEFMMELTGRFMALFANAHRDEKKKLSPYTRQDFFRLTNDKPDVPEVKPSLETFDQLTAKHGIKRKRKDVK